MQIGYLSADYSRKIKTTVDLVVNVRTILWLHGPSNFLGYNKPKNKLHQHCRPWMQLTRSKAINHSRPLSNNNG